MSSGEYNKRLLFGLKRYGKKVRPNMSVYLPDSLPASLPLCLSSDQADSLPASLPVSLSSYQTDSLPASASLSVFLPAGQFACYSVCLPATCLPTFLSVFFLDCRRPASLISLILPALSACLPTLLPNYLKCLECH